MIQYSLTSYLQFNIICSYIYDGWNLIREKTVGLATEDRGLQTAKSLQFTVYSLKSYFWGLDVSGSLGGAGGVGGLLQLAVGSNSPYITKLSAEALAKERQKTDLFGPSSQKSEINNLKLYFPHYDHIGNIIAYTNESEEIAAVYDYSGFGELIRSDGSMKEDFSLQFSTKYIDRETNLYYYGYRFYNPQMGRWISRDPIGEIGGNNLYHFINNDAINNWDYMGMLIGKVVGAYSSATGIPIPTSKMDVVTMALGISSPPTDIISTILNPTSTATSADLTSRKKYTYKPYEIKEKFIASPFKGKSLEEVESELGNGCPKNGMEKLEMRFDPNFMFSGGLEPMYKVSGNY